MIDEDGNVNFNEITLEAIKGKFYFEHPRKKNTVYEVSHDQFRILLVRASQDKSNGITIKKSNSYEYLMSQLVMNEDLFQAMLYPKWVI